MTPATHITERRPSYARVTTVLAIAILSLACANAAPAQASFGIVPGSFTTEALNQNGTIDTQAGSHPYSYTISFALNRNPNEEVEGVLRDALLDLPRGLIGNPRAVPQCPRGRLEGLDATCPGDTQIGVLHADFEGLEVTIGLYNLDPPVGKAAEIGANADGLKAITDASVRTGAGYGVEAATHNIPTQGISSVSVTIWGIPGEESHDPERTCGEGADTTTGLYGAECAKGLTLRPFLRLPTSCAGPLETILEVDSRETPGDYLPAEALSLDAGDNPIGLTGCGRLVFEPSLEVRTGATSADAATGLQVDLKLPQIEQPEDSGAADLKSAVVTLPPGMTVNPSTANGLQACTPEQVALSSPEPAHCPQASKIGAVQVRTPLIEHPLFGSVYVAAQEDNPFGSLLAIYLAINDPETGVVVKLAGHVEVGGEPGGGAGLAPGQLRTTFSENPQLPFEDLKLELYGGPRAPLITPSSCATDTVTSDLTPWSSPQAPDATPSSSFQIDEGCGPPGFAPTFAAGTLASQAAAYSPLVISFGRNDGEQEFHGLEQTLPPGLLAKLAGVPLCSSAAAESGSCPLASQIGTVSVSAGVGPDPVQVPGTIYLTGPYNGGPFGEVVEVPAIAGPFDLDENGRPVVVRGSIRVNPATAQASVVSDPFPTMLRGIPLQVRSVTVTLNRPGFTFNGTNCTQQSITGTLSSTAGATAPVSSPYEPVNCATLPFHPSFSASTAGVTSKANGASFTVKVSQGAGEANIHKVDLQLPLALPARLTTLQKACTQAQFAANPAGCPEGSVIGTAIAHTPLLANPLTGPAYLVSHGGAAFPDVEFVLQGENGIEIVLDGLTDIKHGITYSKFETVPDAPISSFETTLPEGPHSALAANGNLCDPTQTVSVKKRVTLRGKGHKRTVTRTVKQTIPASLTAPTTITGQNGGRVAQSTSIQVTGCPKSKPKTAKKAKIKPKGKGGKRG